MKSTDNMILIGTKNDGEDFRLDPLQVCDISSFNGNIKIHFDPASPQALRHGNECIVDQPKGMNSDIQERLVREQIATAKQEALDVRNSFNQESQEPQKPEEPQNASDSNVLHFPKRAMQAMKNFFR